MPEITEHGLLEVLADFDGHGGASLGLVAWELWVTEQQVKNAWETAQTAGWLKAADTDTASEEQLWRLTPPGWAAYQRARLVAD